MIGNRIGIKNVDYPGQFRLSRKMLVNKSSLVKQIMKNIFIVRAEYIFIEDSIHYMGFSPLFFPIFEGNRVPEYELIIYEDNRFYFQRIKI